MTTDRVARILDTIDAGLARVTQAVADATKSTIKAVPAFDKALDAVGGIFNRDWKLRNLPDAIKLKQAHLNR